MSFWNCDTFTKTGSEDELIKYAFYKVPDKYKDVKRWSYDERKYKSIEDYVGKPFTISRIDYSGDVATIKCLIDEVEFNMARESLEVYVGIYQAPTNDKPCTHEDKYINHVFTSRFWVCRSCKKDLGNA